MNGDTKKVALPVIAVITVILSMFGWMRFDIGNNTKASAENTQVINGIKVDIEKINGKTDKILETLRWLEKVGEDYQKANKQGSIDGFLEFLTKTNGNK